MNSEEGKSYAWVFAIWVVSLIVIALVTYATDFQQLMYLFSLVVPVGGIAPLYIQIKTKRRLTSMWQLGRHHDDDPATYKMLLILNFLIICWLVFWVYGSLQQLANT